MPKITSFTPQGGRAWVQVVITGENFSSTVSDDTVKFNGSTATVISATTTQLIVIVPVGFSPGKISVTVGNQTSISAVDFLRLASPTAPEITGFSPAAGKAGDLVGISGKNFISFAIRDTVRFNGALAVVTNASTTWLSVIVPAGSSSGKISVTVNYETAISSTDFLVLPTINSTVSTFAGTSVGGSLDGPAMTAQFSYPDGIAIDLGGNLFVSDSYNRRIRKITPSGAVTTIATFSNPSSVPKGLALDVSGNMYVADDNLNLIYKVSPSGVVNILAGNGLQGYVDANGLAAAFNHPLDVAVDGFGNVFVADFANHRIRKITPQGNVTTFAGSDTSTQMDGMGLASRFNFPKGIAIDAAGNLYLSENAKIRKITSAGLVTTIAGSVGGFADGFAMSAQFYLPKGIAVDASGNIYIGERTRIRKITTTGLVLTVAGDGNFGFMDGPGASAEFFSAEGIVADPSGNIFVADNLNNRIRKITF